MMTSGLLTNETSLSLDYANVGKCLAALEPEYSQTFELDMGLTSTEQEPNWTLQ